MSVVCDGINVIVRCDEIRLKYPGGLAAYEQDAPNDSYCSDGHIARIGFMTPWHADAFLERLFRHGFAFVRDGQCADIAVVDQHAGLARPCRWLQTAEIPGLRIACLVGQSVGRVMAPSGWVRDRAEPLQLDSVGPSVLQESLGFESHVNGGRPVVVWRSLGTEN